MENFSKQNFYRGLKVMEQMSKLKTSLSKEEYDNLLFKHEEVLSNAREFISGIDGDSESNWFAMFKEDRSESKTYFESLSEEEKDVLCRALVAELLL